jgi:hypothetical protein
MTLTTNGHKTTDLSAVEIITEPIKKKYHARCTQNKAVDIKLDLDAGSSRAKFVIDGWSGSYPSIFKEVSGELPSGISGCFHHR